MRLRPRSLFWTFTGSFLVVMIVAAIALLGWISARMLAFATEIFTGVP